MNNAVVIGGQGVVGKATRLAFKIKSYYDLLGSNITWEDVCKKRYIFLSLPTPALKKGHDIRVLNNTIMKIERESNIKHLYIVRSTTTPGQLEKIEHKLYTGSHIVHLPEFLTMSTWKEDANCPDIVMVGSDDTGSGKEVMNIMKKRFGYWKTRYFLTDLATSQLTKCAINNFYALKVVFANELFDFAKKVGAEYETVKRAMYARKWVGNNHLDVYFNGVRGVRGPCLPKELKAMAGATNSKLLQTALEINNKLVK